MLKEIYNDNNLKVYADSDEYKVVIHRGPFTNYYTLTKNRIYDIVQGEVSKVRNCTITVQGTKLIIEGELEDGFINNYGLDTTLKGDINVRVESEHNMYSCVYNLYKNANIVLGEYNSPQNHTCFLYDNSSLSVTRETQGTWDILAYDNAKVVTYGGPTTPTITLYNKSTASAREKPNPEIYAYDNSTVFSDDDENVHLFDNATNINYI